MATTTVTRNYQITLPKDVREVENIKVGDRLSLNIRGDSIEIRKFSKERIMGCFGAWGKSTETSVETVRKIRDESEQRLKRLGL